MNIYSKYFKIKSDCPAKISGILDIRRCVTSIAEQLAAARRGLTAGIAFFLRAFGLSRCGDQLFIDSTVMRLTKAATKMNNLL